MECSSPSGVDIFEFVHKAKIHERNDKLKFVRKVAYEVCAGLRDYAQAGLTHKDIKMENIVYTVRLRSYKEATLPCSGKLLMVLRCRHAGILE